MATLCSTAGENVSSIKKGDSEESPLYSQLIQYLIEVPGQAV